MRLFPRQLLNPCAGSRGMGGGRRKSWNRLWAWTGNRVWRKSRSSLTIVVFFTLIWLCLISVLNIESGIDYSSERGNNLRAYSVDHGHNIDSGGYPSYLRQHHGNKYSNSGVSYGVIGVVNNQIDTRNVDTRDTTVIESNTKITDYKTKRIRLSDQSDNRRVIPGRRIQEIRSVRSGGLENRKPSFWRGERKTAETFGWRADESIVTRHGQSNPSDLQGDQDFYETGNEAVGKSGYPFFSSSFSSHVSNLESATDTNAGEKKTSRVTPGNIPVQAQPTNWGKVEPASALVSRSSSSTKIAWKRNSPPSHHKNAVTAQNTILSLNQSLLKRLNDEYVHLHSVKQMLQNPGEGIVKSSNIIEGDGRYEESPKMSHHVSDGNDGVREKERTELIDKTFSGMDASDLNLSGHRPRTGAVVPRSRISKESKVLVDELFKPEGAVTRNGVVGLKKKTRQFEKLIDRGKLWTTFMGKMIPDEKGKIGFQQFYSSGNIQNVGQNDNIFHKDNNSSVSSFSSPQNPPPISSSQTSQILNAPSLPSVTLSSIASSSSSFFPAIATAMTTRSSRPNTPNSQMKNESDKADGNLSVVQSDQMIAQPDDRARGKNNGLPPFTRVDTHDSKMANGRRENGAVVGKPTMLRNETGRGTKQEEMTKSDDKKSDILRDDRVNLRYVINVSGLGNRTLMMTAPTGESKNRHQWKMEDVMSQIQQTGKPLESDGFVKYAYNVTVSDVIGNRRDIPDTRPQGCDRLPAYSDSMVSLLPRASVVICFHNEAVSVLLRTIRSVLDKTPAHLLDRVILVDDDSTDDALVRLLPSFIISEFGPVVELTRTSQREGLVRARLLGSSLVTSPIIVFLDAHVECNVGWLEPLVYALLSPGIKVVSPYIDTIKAETFEYRQSPPGLQGGFNWRLEFGWRAATNNRHGENETNPILTPVISGGLFAVRRDTFQTLGGYDPQLEVWGGENLELSFKTWMCGGSMAILPCSRVGHVFRSTLPYNFKDGDRERTVLRNLGRVARVWMDGYADVFEAAVNFPPDLDLGNLTERQQLRYRLQCKSFQWYLDQIHPQLEVVTPSTQLYGQVKNKGSLMCIDVSHNDLRRAPQIHLSACKGDKNQTLHLTTQGHLKLGSYCIVPGPDKTLTFSSCRENFTWVYQTQHIHPTLATHLCMTSVDNEFIQLLPCDSNQEVSNTNESTNKHISKIDSSIFESNSSLMNGNTIFQQWEFQYSFHWKRKRRK